MGKLATTEVVSCEVMAVVETPLKMTVVGGLPPGKSVPTILISDWCTSTIWVIVGD